jgi:hypothetical protein
MRLGVVRQVDPIVTAYAHIGMIERVALGLLREPSSPPASEVIRELLSIAYLGLKPRSPNKPNRA